MQNNVTAQLWCLLFESSPGSTQVATRTKNNGLCNKICRFTPASVSFGLARHRTTGWNCLSCSEAQCFVLVDKWVNKPVKNQERPCRRTWTEGCCAQTKKSLCMPNPLFISVFSSLNTRTKKVHFLCFFIGMKPAKCTGCEFYAVCKKRIIQTNKSIGLARTAYT